MTPEQYLAREVIRQSIDDACCSYRDLVAGSGYPLNREIAEARAMWGADTGRWAEARALWCDAADIERTRARTYAVERIARETGEDVTQSDEWRQWIADPKRKGVTTTRETVAVVQELFSAGWTLNAIADYLNISRTRVAYIRKRAKLVAERAAQRLMVLLALAALAAPAAAHNAPAGWSYDPECCSGTDCAQAVDGAIREVAGGYSVVVMPGTHPMVPAGSQPVTGFVPHGDPRIRVSGDEHRHVCVMGGRVLCIYVPPGGV